MGKVSKWPVRTTTGILVLSVAAALTFQPTPSYAGSKNALIGLGIGAIIGMGIANSARRAPPHTRRRRPSAAASIGARDRREVRQIQSALSSLGYYRQRVDGIGGRGTRSAISNFQADRGFNPTGRLNRNQKAELLASTENAYGNYRRPAYGNPYQPSYAGGNPNGEVDVFGNGAANQALPGQSNEGAATIFDNQAPRQAGAPPARPAQPITASPKVDSSELATIFATPQQPNTFSAKQPNTFGGQQPTAFGGKQPNTFGGTAAASD